MAIGTEDKINKNVKAKDELDIGALSGVTAKVDKLDADELALEKRLVEIKEKRTAANAEKAAVEAEVKKIPPVLAGGLKELQALDKKIAEMVATRKTNADGWKVEATKSGVSEGFINKVLGIRATGTGVGGKKVDSATREEQILNAINEGHDTISKIQDIVGLSQKSRDILKAMEESGKVNRSDAGKYNVV